MIGGKRKIVLSITKLIVTRGLSSWTNDTHCSIREHRTLVMIYVSFLEQCIANTMQKMM